MGKLIREYSRATDWTYLLLCMACSVLSVLTLVSIGTYNLGGFETDMGQITGIGGYRTALVQAVASLLGVAMAIGLSCIDYRAMVQAWPLHVAGAWGLVALTFLKMDLGPVSLGWRPEGTDNYSWIRVAGLSLQPTELAKISFILTFAMHLAAVKDDLNDPPELLKLLAHMAVPVVIIHFQGDDGTALCFAVIFLFMLFSAGLSWRFIAAGVGAVVVAVPILWNFVLSDMQKRRFLILFNPELDPLGDAFQQIQSKNAIGSGGVFGLGLFGETPVEVPYMRNDFIFAYIGQTMGFVGGTMVVLALLFVALKMLLNGLRSVDKYGYFICVGVFAIFFFQIFINIGMCLGFMPVIGLTLPFLSAGGTSVVMLYLSVGIVQSVFMHGKRDLFS